MPVMAARRSQPSEIELLHLRFGMHEHDIGIATPASIEIRRRDQQNSQLSNRNQLSKRIEPQNLTSVIESNIGDDDTLPNHALSQPKRQSSHQCNLCVSVLRPSTQKRPAGTSALVATEGP